VFSYSVSRGGKRYKYRTRSSRRAIPIVTSSNQEIGPKEAFNAGSKMEEEYPEYLCSICKNRRPKIEWKRDFSYLELTSATQGFAKKNFLSEGGFGSVYSGEVDGLKIAVKQHKNASFQGEKEFKAEVHVLSKVRHKNLVRLLGSCSEGSSRLLVFEYVCNGSLDQHLSSKNEIKSKDSLL
jgi:serine/threonine protein kinase